MPCNNRPLLRLLHMLQLTKTQRKRANRQQKAAMQLSGSSPDSPSPMANASSAPAPTSGAQLQVCPLTNPTLIISCALNAYQHMCASKAYQHMCACALLLNDSKCCCLIVLHLTHRRLCTSIIKPVSLDHIIGSKHLVACDCLSC